MPRTVLFSLALALACSPTPRQRAETASSNEPTATDTVAAAAGIDSLKARFLAAYNRDDPKALAETYTEDVNFILDGTLIHGRPAVEQGWKENVSALAGLKFSPIERKISGDVGMVADRFEQQYKMPNGRTVTDSGYALSMVQRGADGQWRWHTLMLSRLPEKR
jgi:uncharacterized protein (TIGR02246 family)